jgi:hypothetical protein
MKNLENITTETKIRRKDDHNPCIRITKISKFNIFIKATNYPSSPFKVSKSSFLDIYEIIENN